jgi:HSP20 family protein
MALVRWNRGRELDALHTDLNRVFDAFFGNATGSGNGVARRWVPAMDVVEDDEHLVLRYDLPGLSEDDVDVEVKDGVLTVSGERKRRRRRRATAITASSGPSVASPAR